MEYILGLFLEQLIIGCSFLQLYILKKKYRISIYMLVNIAIKNALDEWEKTTDENTVNEYKKGYEKIVDKSCKI